MPAVLPEEAAAASKMPPVEEPDEEDLKLRSPINSFKKKFFFKHVQNFVKIANSKWKIKINFISRQIELYF